MITAHGGALGTGRNSQKYFDGIDRYGAQALEVDIRRVGGELILSHNPTLCKRGKLTLAYALGLAKERGLRINCDTKSRNLAPDVERLAKQLGATANIYFTGSVDEREAANLTECEVYFNRLQGIAYTQGNAAQIRRRLESYASPVYAGINVSRARATKAFLQECLSEGVKVSLYTVDKDEELAVYCPMGLFNITTNRPDRAAQIVAQCAKGDCV